MEPGATRCISSPNQGAGQQLDDERQISALVRPSEKGTRNEDKAECGTGGGGSGDRGKAEKETKAGVCHRQRMGFRNDRIKEGWWHGAKGVCIPGGAGSAPPE